MAGHCSSEVVFLTDGKIKLGVDMGKGAGVSHFQLCDGQYNLLNAYDAGRLVQVKGRWQKAPFWLLLAS